MTLSNGVKILQHVNPLHYYATQNNCVHGLNLQYYMKTVGGDGEEESGEIARLFMCLIICV